MAQILQLEVMVAQIVLRLELVLGQLLALEPELVPVLGLQAGLVVELKQLEPILDAQVVEKC